jgi:hypothetical protein
VEWPKNLLEAVVTCSFPCVGAALALASELIHRSALGCVLAFVTTTLANASKSVTPNKHHFNEEKK